MSCAYDRTVVPSSSRVTPPRVRASSRAARGALTCTALAVTLAVTGCTAGSVSAGSTSGGLRATTSPGAPSTSPVAAATAAPDAGPRQDVTALRGRRDADVLLVSPTPLPAAVRTAVAELSSPAGTQFYRAGTVTVEGRPLPAVGVDASSFRAFTAQGTAEADAVWQAVARGEAVVSHDTAAARGLVLGADLAVVGPGGEAPTTLRLGAVATTGVPGADLVLDAELARRLGLPAGNAALLTAPAGQDRVSFAAEVREVAGAAAVDLLRAPDPVARLTGGEAAQDLGTFTYRYFADGTIEPDPDWVRANIRTEVVPIMGRVTCHRLMLPQLRGALQEVADAGLAGTLTTFDGCYVPRFIERDPARAISLHTWGIAIDMDAATNYRGIAGTMDPRVVAIFKRWGFRWGGDWRYTDPMHFELGTLVTPSPAG